MIFNEVRPSGPENVSEISEICIRRVDGNYGYQHGYRDYTLVTNNTVTMEIHRFARIFWPNKSMIYRKNQLENITICDCARCLDLTNERVF